MSQRIISLDHATLFFFQWAGEVISSREKIAVHEEFQDLEKDIELRRDGVQRSVVWCPTLSSQSKHLPLGIRLLVASEDYYQILSKKQASDSLMQTEKFLPIDTLGLVMIGHGEEFGLDSSFGAFLKIDHNK